MNIMHRIKLDGTVAAVGFHQGFPSVDSGNFFQSEMQILEKLSPRKKTEWVASRELLYTIAELPERAECLYDDFGKPYLSGIPKFISVSHSASWASAMMSNSPCGIDIQVYSKTVETISSRFLSSEEWRFVPEDHHRLHRLHLLWGAKECIYKAFGKRKLEFRHHIFINSLDPHHSTGKGEIKFEDLHLQYDLHYRMLPEAAWVLCILRNSST